ncbi:MAG: glycosyltransferase family 39 protein [Microthrixaceae bacterium]
MAAITLSGFFLRVAWLLIARPAAVSDALGYKSLALRWIGEGLYERFGEPTAWRSPGYIALLAVGSLVSESDLWLGFMNVIASSAAIPLTAILANRLGLGNRVGNGAAAFVAIMPAMVFWAPVLGPENIQTPLLLAALALAAARRRSARSLVMAGLFMGIAILVRPESLFYLPVVGIAMWPSPWRTILRETAIVVAMAVAVCMPWVIRNQVQVGPVGLSSVGGVNFYLAHRADGYGFAYYDTTDLAGLSEVEMNREGYRIGMQSLRDQPTRLLGDIVEGTRRLYSVPRYAPFFSTRGFATQAPYPRAASPSVLGTARAYTQIAWYAIGSLSIAGWVILLVRRHRAALVTTAMVFSNWFCFTVVFWALPRYRFPIEPMISICAAVGLFAAVSTVRTIRSDRARKSAQHELADR